MSFSITGKTAIVTGAASGIGLAIVRHFADKGANVMCADEDEARLEAELGDAARGDGPIRLFAGDLCQKLTIANLLSATLDAFDRVDILVNASRRMALSDPLNPDADEVADLFRQNMLTALRLTQMTAKRMIQSAERGADADPDGGAGAGDGRGGMVGSIINLSSSAAQITQAELLGYSISCAAVEQMTRSMAVALAPRRIRVNAVAFGSVMSASLQTALKGNSAARDQIVACTPLGRIAGPDELAETVQFLASDASAFMTGQVLTLDGGRGLLDPVKLPAH